MKYFIRGNVLVCEHVEEKPDRYNTEKKAAAHFRIQMLVEYETKVGEQTIKTSSVESCKSDITVPTGEQLLEVDLFAIDKKIYPRIRKIVILKK